MRFLTTATALLFSTMILAACSGFDGRTGDTAGTATPGQTAETDERSTDYDRNGGSGY